MGKVFGGAWVEAPEDERCCPPKIDLWWSETNILVCKKTVLVGTIASIPYGPAVESGALLAERLPVGSRDRWGT